MNKECKVIKETVVLSEGVCVEIPYTTLTEEASRLLSIKYDTLRAEKRDFNKSFKGRTKKAVTYIGKKVGIL